MDWKLQADTVFTYKRFLPNKSFLWVIGSIKSLSLYKYVIGLLFNTISNSLTIVNICYRGLFDSTSTLQKWLCSKNYRSSLKTIMTVMNLKTV